MNSLPLPGPSLCAVTVPPCSSTRRLTSVSPMPRPPWRRPSDGSTWVNMSKMLGSISGGNADAVSRTVTTASPPCRSAVSQMRPPRSVYLAALFRRFATAWASRVGSASR